MNSIICDVLVIGHGLAALAASAAATGAGARTVLIDADSPEDRGAGQHEDDALLAAILAETSRRAGNRLLPGGEIQRVHRQGRSIAALALDDREICARFFVDASRHRVFLARAGAAVSTVQEDELGAGREFIDTIALADGPDGRYALPYRLALLPDLDNVLVVPPALPGALAVPAGHAIGTAAALLAASGQPAERFDPATLRERLREAGAPF